METAGSPVVASPRTPGRRAGLASIRPQNARRCAHPLGVPDNIHQHLLGSNPRQVGKSQSTYSQLGRIQEAVAVQQLAIHAHAAVVHTECGAVDVRASARRESPREDLAAFVIRTEDEMSRKRQGISVTASVLIMKYPRRCARR
jgi:hypothetical protein